MSRYFFLILLSLITLGCASTHPRKQADSSNKSVSISIDRDSNLSDKYYYFYEYTIENKDADWKDIQVVDINFDGENTEVLTDDNLSAWIEGAELKLKASQYNQDLLIGSMAAVGGATGVAGGTALSRARGKTTSGVKGENGTVNVPKTHILVPSKVAPESYIHRWIVVKAPTEATAIKSTSKNPSPQNKKFFLQHKLTTDVKIDGKVVRYTSIVDTVRAPAPR